MKCPKELFLTSGYSDDSAYQQYLQRVLATTSNKGLHMQDDTGRNSQPTAALLPLCPQGKQDSAFPLAPHNKTVYPRAPDHVFQPNPEISLRTRAAWDNHPDCATLFRESIIAGATAAARYGYSWDGAAHVKHVISIWEHNRFFAAEMLKPPLLWTARSSIWITTSKCTADSVIFPRRPSGNLGAPHIKRP